MLVSRNSMCKGPEVKNELSVSEEEKGWSQLVE